MQLYFLKVPAWLPSRNSKMQLIEVKSPNFNPSHFKFMVQSCRPGTRGKAFTDQLPGVICRHFSRRQKNCSSGSSNNSGIVKRGLSVIGIVLSGITQSSGTAIAKPFMVIWTCRGRMKNYFKHLYMSSSVQ